MKRACDSQCLPTWHVLADLLAAYLEISSSCQGAVHPSPVAVTIGMRDAAGVIEEESVEMRRSWHREGTALTRVRFAVDSM